MWTPDKSKLVKICLHSCRADVETPWAEDLGVSGTPPVRRVRIGNVPFLHAKPTYGDVLIVEHDSKYGRLTWDAAGVPHEQIGARIAEDGGRWAMILDYTLVAPATDAPTAFKALDKAGDEADIAVEGCYAPKALKAGRAYLAVPCAMTPDDVLRIFQARGLPLTLTLVHPVATT